MFLKECKYIEKKKKVIRHIIDYLESSSDDFDDFDEECVKANHRKVGCFLVDILLTHKYAYKVQILKGFYGLEFKTNF